MINESTVPLAGMAYYFLFVMDPAKREHWVDVYMVPSYVWFVLLYLVSEFMARRRQLIALADATAAKRRKKLESSRQKDRIGDGSRQSAAASDGQSSVASSHGNGDRTSNQPIDMTGAYKLVENRNYEPFLAVQGVPWALRGAANQARPTHRITHVGNKLTVKIEGIIESQTTYTISGPPVKSYIRGRQFEDLVSYWRDGEPEIPPSQQEDNDENTDKDTGLGRVVGVKVRKRAVDEGYTVYARRRLTEDNEQLVMTSVAVFDDDDRENVATTQIFRRIE